MGANYARKEVEGQPWGGWSVNLHRHWCPCGSCVHVVFVLWATAHVDSNGQEILVSGGNDDAVRTRVPSREGVHEL
ncbi:hypothetical protein PHMEG_00030887 [Phytophthora megakarya]|uniref:Uncharacterized protein n=1 Tax=Phytophthora megakarya TaxID=4795 RepID=A0A225UZD9_9STRA|nr:hypothetical protein PHMEG_00030887 [Phytophthora megakarya]